MARGKYLRPALLAGFTLLAACGGTTSDTAETPAAPNRIRLLSTTITSGSASSTGAVNSVAQVPVSKTAASHFLAQASMGPSPETIAAVTVMGPAAWLEYQFTIPQSQHLGFLQRYAAKYPSVKITAPQFTRSFWQQALSGEDQVRQRMAYALSQIFVVSTNGSDLWQFGYGVAHYYDVLANRGFGNFRDLLEGVATSPMMGLYLSHLHNMRESGTRMPDENFAREIMQLMTIGLYQLNQDGTPKLVSGKPVETYTHDDVMGLAKVFTGWSWAGPDQSEARFFGTVSDPSKTWMPMQNYPAYHSTSTKTFLGATTNGDGKADLKVALDTLFNHPNVGPFIGRQLIQRLVTSNPSPAYVSRVAAAFANNGSGVRGDMKAVLRAILLDAEAMDATKPKKVREPVLRVANWLRAFQAKSNSGWYLAWGTSDANTALSQSVLESSSVFNFYRPGYTPPGSELAASGMVAPELQLATMPSVAGYLNMMQDAIVYGFGQDNDMRPDYANELALVSQPDQLVERMNMLLLNGTMSTSLRNQMITALNSVVQPEPKSWNKSDVTIARNNRVYLAIYLAMASPEYIVQK
jgi:uncharacterized protein (DUF1800 family)